MPCISSTVSRETYEAFEQLCLRDGQTKSTRLRQLIETDIATAKRLERVAPLAEERTEPTPLLCTGACLSRGCNCVRS
jgi:predicted DNA-binding protein